MRRTSSCSPRTLASGDVARVDVCDHCGIFVLHVGPVSLRVEPSALDSLTRTLIEAQRLLGDRAAEEHDEHSTAVLNPAWAPRGRA